MTRLVAQLRPECPGDSEALAALRQVGVELARAQAESNTAAMRSAVARRRAAAQRNARLWASAANVLRGALEDLDATATARDAALASRALMESSGVSEPSSAKAGDAARAPATGGPASSNCRVVLHESSEVLANLPGVRWMLVDRSAEVGTIFVVPVPPGQTPAQANFFSTLSEARASASTRCPSQ